MDKHIVIDARNRQSSTGRYTDRLLEHLQEIDKINRYTILVAPDDEWQPKSENFKTKISHFKQFSFNPIDQITFPLQLKSLRPDLVHFTMTQQPLFYSGNIVTTTHDLTMLEFARPGRTPLPVFWLKKFAYKLLFNRAHKKSKKIIVPTKYVAGELEHYQPFTREKVVVTYEASEPSISGASVPVENVNKPFILHVGSPFPHKNIYKLIQAFEFLLQKYPNLTLVLAGKKEFYFEQLEERTKNRPSFDSIRFTGFIPDEQLKWLYENAEAYVLPSLSEGFGLPGLEAMAHGCPVVSSNATSLPEVYGYAAYYFHPHNPADIARAVDTVMESKEVRSELIENGKAQIEKYSWQKMAQQTLDTYNSIF